MQNTRYRIQDIGCRTQITGCMKPRFIRIYRIRVNKGIIHDTDGFIREYRIKGMYYGIHGTAGFIRKYRVQRLIMGYMVQPGL